MIPMCLFFFGIFTLTIDIMEGKRGFLALVWNNMRFFIVFQSLYWFAISLIVLVLNIETMTGVISKINDMGLGQQIQMWVITSGFIFTMSVLAIALMFKKLKYKKAKGVNE